MADNTALQVVLTEYMAIAEEIGPNRSPRVSEIPPGLLVQNPTLRPVQDFSARLDAEVLRRAMKGFGTDEKAIIGVITKRTNAQRQEIVERFKRQYDRDLMKDLKSELSGSFEDLVVALMTPIHVYYAEELHDALSGFHADENALIEMLCTLSKHEMCTIHSTYHSLYGSYLESDLGNETSGTIRRILISLCQSQRDECDEVDAAECRQVAENLLRACDVKCGKDELMFAEVLCSRSSTQLLQIFTDFETIIATGQEFETAIMEQFTGDLRNGLLAIAKSVRNKAAFFAERLYASMYGLGTSNRTLIRIIVTRCEVDLADIKREFQSQYGKSLESFISGDTSGDYKRCLLELVS